MTASAWRTARVRVARRNTPSADEVKSRTATPKIECVLDARATTGETPAGCEREQALYWIDVEEPALHCFDPATGGDIW